MKRLNGVSMPMRRCAGLWRPSVVSRPLEHLTILDLSRVLACPFASMILAELGATVIKVEQPGTGDETRSLEPFVNDDPLNESAYYFACNRSKQSITVNLRDPDGQQLVRDLARSVDVVMENFPVGTLKRYGLDAPTLRAANDRLIYVSCTGFGQTGPYKDRKGYDTVFQAMGGITSLTGELGGGPVKPGLPVADLSSGLWIAIGILAAVAGRGERGHGATIDFGMLDGQVALLTTAAARYFALGEVPPRLGTEHPGRVPSATFACSDGRHLHITVSDQHWLPLCTVLGLDAWGAQSCFATNSARVRARQQVMSELTRTISEWGRDELGLALDAAGVPQGPVNTLDEVLVDPQVLARTMVQHFDHPKVGEFKALPLPFKFDGWDAPRLDRPPLLGEHTDEVLGSRLGLNREQITLLREKGAI